MKKHFDYLSLFGEDDKTKKETDSEKLARIEKALEDKDKEIAQLKAEKTEMEKTMNSLKLDGLAKKVEPAQDKVEDEEITFDFDI